MPGVAGFVSVNVMILSADRVPHADTAFTLIVFIVCDRGDRYLSSDLFD